MDSISKTLASLVKLPPPPLRISPDFNFFASALPKILGGGERDTPWLWDYLCVKIILISLYLKELLSTREIVRARKKRVSWSWRSKHTHTHSSF